MPPPQPAPIEPRPKFTTPLEFGLWALNASDAEVNMGEKIRAMQAMMAHAGKAAPEKQDAKPAEEVAGGLYAPRAPRLVPFPSRRK